MKKTIAILLLTACTLCAQVPTAVPTIPPLAPPDQVRDAVITGFLVSLGSTNQGATAILAAMSDDTRATNYLAVRRAIMGGVVALAAVPPGLMLHLDSAILQVTDGDITQAAAAAHYEDAPPLDGYPRLRIREIAAGKVILEPVDVTITLDIDAIPGLLEALKKRAQATVDASHQSQ